MRRSVQRWVLLLLLAVPPAHAIEAPSKSRPASTDSPPTEPFSAVVATTDPQTLHPQLVRTAHRQRFARLNVETSVVDAMVGGDIAGAVAQLSAKAQTNDPASNIALVRVQHWCARIPPPDRHRDVKLLEQLRPQLSEAEIERLQKLITLELKYEASALKSCQQAQFDYRLIEAQLREAADAGEPMSVTELAKLETRPARIEELLQQAASKNYAPAQYALAMHRLMAVQRGEQTQNVGTIRVLLKQAGRTLSQAKLDLANCMALGCDGHPRDVAGAVVFGLDAARDGERDAFASIARMPWAARLPMEQRLAWQYFGQRLNESGCFGEHYLQMFRVLRENVAAYEKNADTKTREEAQSIAENYWQQFGARAQREQHCSP
jgi:hypothetical protein